MSSNLMVGTRVGSTPTMVQYKENHKHMEYLPVSVFEVEGYTAPNNTGKLNARFSKMKDGKFIKSFYLKLGGRIFQHEITEKVFIDNKKFEVLLK